MTEHRLFHRISFVTKTEVAVNGESRHAGLVDISLKGALVEFPEEVPLQKGMPCHIEVLLNLSELVLSFDGVVIHSHGRLAGAKFTKVGVESMMHLRRLLELNSGDAEQVRSELEALLEAE